MTNIKGPHFCYLHLCISLRIDIGVIKWPQCPMIKCLISMDIKSHVIGCLINQCDESLSWGARKSPLLLYITTWLCGFWRQAISCVTKASACHHAVHANQCTSQIIAVKSNVTTVIQIPRFVVNMFYYGRVVFIVFKHADTKGVRHFFTSTASLDIGYCEATISVDNGHHVTE